MPPYIKINDDGNCKGKSSKPEQPLSVTTHSASVADDCPDISLIVPVYNEQERIAASLYQIKDYLENSDFSYEVLVIDDGSNDLTTEVVKFVDIYGAEIKSQPEGRLKQNNINQGKGYSIANGMLSSRGHVVIFTDADAATPISELPKLMNKIEQGYDVAIGTRKHAMSLASGRTPLRLFLSWGFNLIARLLGLVNVRDSQCGFKAYTREAAIKVAETQKTNRFCFDVEQLFIATRLGYKIGEVPVIWNHSEGSSLSLLRDSFHMFVDLLRIRYVHRNL